MLAVRVHGHDHGRAVQRGEACLQRRALASVLGVPDNFCACHGRHYCRLIRGAIVHYYDAIGISLRAKHHTAYSHFLIEGRQYSRYLHPENTLPLFLLL